jgi:xylulokinase
MEHGGAGMIYLGVDIGTTSAKCLAVGEDGTILGLAQHPYPMQHPRQGWAEQDPEDYWNALVDVVSRCVRECEDKEVAALALSTQGDTLIVTDSSGVPLCPAITWMDTRGESEYRDLLAEKGASFWYKEIGIPLAPTSSACSIRWLRNNAPDLWGRIARFCYVPDFLAFRLTGRFVTDMPSASWTPLCNPSARSWSIPVLEILGVDTSQLPDLVESGEPIGRIPAEVAGLLGLPESATLIAGAFDQAAAALGAGAKPGERSVLSCGTAWVLCSVSDSPIEDAGERIPVYCHTSPSQWGMVLPFTGGAAYDWLTRTLAPESADGASDADPLIFIPHLYGGLCPDWRSESRGSLLGLTMAHTSHDIRLALMRGVACEARRNVEAAERLCGSIGSIRMVGGAGRSDLWPRMVANMLNKNVEVADCIECACYGAARLAAGSASEKWKDPGTLRTCDPDPGDAEAESRFYAKYLRFCETLLGLYK